MFEGFHTSLSRAAEMLAEHADSMLQVRNIGGNVHENTDARAINRDLVGGQRI